MFFLFSIDDLILRSTDAGSLSDEEILRLPDLFPVLDDEVTLALLISSDFAGLKRKMPLHWRGQTRCGTFSVKHSLDAGRCFIKVCGECNLPAIQAVSSSGSDSPLLVSEKTLATIIELAVDGIVIINQSGIVQGFNRAAEKMFGYNACEVLNENVSMLTPEPHRSQHDEYMRRYLNTRIPHIIGIGRQVDAQRRDGSIFPIDLAVGEVRLESGSLFTGFIRDLSESRKLESERNSFFQMSLDLFCILDFDGKFKRVNPQWQDIMGYTDDELAGIDFASLIHPDDLGESGQLLTDILGVRNVVGRVMRLRKKNGEYLWMLWNSSVDRANQAIYGVSRDITRQRQILEELQHAKQDAERSSQAKSIFIAKMNHELRTPLNSIIGFSRHLQRNAEQFTPREILFLERISRNGESLLQLINTILDYSRSESGFIEVNEASVNAADLLAEVVDLMQVLIEEKGIDFELRLPAVCCEISSDLIKLRQIMQNLIDNAVKFSNHSKVLVELIVDDNNVPVKIIVADSGPGIAKDQLKIIFAAFQQGDNSLARRYGGAGLGLAIARSFAELLGLRITVKSRLGQGSTFTLHLKRQEGKKNE